ncbi:MAG: hypothetical protein ABJL43_01390 [Maribacter dokdonensis]|uniref:hypothetical protein n=1 Tax=Maribacter dokdonensis TaxID=320912 RepID=UPI0032980929
MSQTILVALISQIIIFIGGILTWYFKSKREDRLIAEEKTREYKIKTYETLLEPLIILLTFTASEKDKLIGKKKMHSVEYKKAAFNLGTFGSDESVRSYNNLMQAFFNIDSDKMVKESKKLYPLIVMTFLSEFLLCIRKDLYSKKTKLKRSETLEFMINDIENYSDSINSITPHRNLYTNYRKDTPPTL